jgi:hypothetical protein
MNYKRFNLICVVLIIFFVVGNFWVWRDRGVVEEVIVELEVVKYVEIMEEISEPIIEVEEEIIEVPVVVFQKSEINLDVPFTSQAPELNWEQPWQDACEEAAILMLDAYYKDYGLSPIFSRDEILKMVEWEENKNWGTSIGVKRVGELAGWYLGRSMSVVENPTVEQIKNYISNGHPVLVLANGKDLPNPYFSGEGPDYHALVIRGYTEDKFITNDPGTRRGENFAYNYNDLINAIHDWNGGDVENGRKVVLVVE